MAKDIPIPTIERLTSGGENRVLSLESNGDGTFRLREECDGYFLIELSAEDLERLGQEFIQIARSQVSSAHSDS